jgi:hypothetical protein
VKLTTHFHLVPRSRMHRAITLLSQYVFMAWCLVKHRDKFTFNFFSSFCMHLKGSGIPSYYLKYLFCFDRFKKILLNAIRSVSGETGFMFTEISAYPQLYVLGATKTRFHFVRSKCQILYRVYEEYRHFHPSFLNRRWYSFLKSKTIVYSLGST